MAAKRLIELTISDLQSSPIWEHWYEGDIEFIRPTTMKEIAEDSNSGHIVLTDFIFNNGQEFIGFCASQDTSGLDYIQPVIIVENGQVEFWKDIDWTAEEKEEALNKLGLEWQEVFPIHYMTQVQCDGKYFSGTIIDFNKA